jgi:hypothetical protein
MFEITAWLQIRGLFCIVESGTFIGDTLAEAKASAAKYWKSKYPDLIGIDMGE